jgi:pantothenate kinase
MPKIDTERHEIKARLIERFSIQRENVQAIQGAEQTAEQAAIAQIETPSRTKDLER